MKKAHAAAGNAECEKPISEGEDSTPVAADLSGWTLHPSERRDFWNQMSRQNLEGAAVLYATKQWVKLKTAKASCLHCIPPTSTHCMRACFSHRLKLALAAWSITLEKIKY